MAGVLVSLSSLVRLVFVLMAGGCCWLVGVCAGGVYDKSYLSFSLSRVECLPFMFVILRLLSWVDELGIGEFCEGLDSSSTRLRRLLVS